MKRNFISKVLFSVFISLTLSSCNNDVSNIDEISTVKSYKEFKNSYKRLSPWNEDEVFIKKVQKVFLTNTKLDYFEERYGIPNWDYAMSFSNFDESYLVVPILKNAKVVDVMKVIRKNNKVFFYEKQNREFIDFFNNIIHGKISNINEKIVYSDSLSAKALVFKCVYRTFTVGCPAGYSDCQPLSQTVSECNWQEEGGNPTQMEFCNPLICDGGGGGGGLDIPEPENINQDIINELQGYPCAQNLVQQLPTLKNDLATSMRQIFANNKNYNITFRPKPGLGTTDGETFSTSSTEFNSFNVIINLNDQVLLNATKEYIIVTMYHEVIHAFLSYEKFRLGNIAFQEQYPGVIVGYDYAPNGDVINRFTYIDGHQQLIPFLTTLQNILSQYNPNLPHDVIVAMSRAGITTLTPQQSVLNSNERNTLLGNSQGTQCP